MKNATDVWKIAPSSKSTDFSRLWRGALCEGFHSGILLFFMLPVEGNLAVKRSGRPPSQVGKMNVFR